MLLRSVRAFATLSAKRVWHLNVYVTPNQWEAKLNGPSNSKKNMGFRRHFGGTFAT
jgi:hypothetical protein